MSDRQARIADELAAKIHALLAGQESGVQGAAIADLAAIWLAGHIVGTAQFHDPGKTAALRREVWEAHCRAVWEFVEHYDRRRGT
jgi:hypothetical protein